MRSTHPIIGERVEDDELALILGATSKRTVQRWRALGETPPSVKVGRRVFTRREAVEEWLRQREAAHGAGI